MIFYSCQKEEDLKKCAEFIDIGKILIFPTDTVYGIGCNPFNEASVLKLFKIKNRPLNKIFPVLTNDISNLSTYANITDEAKILTEYFWPGQLTIILKVQNNTPFPKHIFDKSIAFRIPNNKCTLKLIQYTKKKLLIGTSANLSGQQPITKNPLTVPEDNSNTSPQVSTIIDLVEPNKPKIKREGIISKEQIFEVLARKM